MKRTIIVILLLIALAVSGCASDDNNDNKQSEIMQKYDMILEGGIEDGFGNGAFDPYYEAEIYIDENAEKSKSITILDVPYTMTYEESAIVPMSDKSVHSYLIDGLEKSRVLIDANSGEPVKWVNIPYTKMPSTEKEGIEFVKSLFPTINFLDYKYECKTHAYTFSKGEMRSRVEDGFLTANENRKIGNYTFLFKQTFGSIDTLSQISATFDEDSITIENFDFGYKFEDFKGFLDELPEIEKAVKADAKRRLSENYDFFNSNIEYKRFFVKDGKPCMLSLVLMEFTGVGDVEIYTTYYRIITSPKS